LSLSQEVTVSSGLKELLKTAEATATIMMVKKEEFKIQLCESIRRCKEMEESNYTIQATANNFESIAQKEVIKFVQLKEKMEKELYTLTDSFIKEKTELGDALKETSLWQEEMSRVNSLLRCELKEIKKELEISTRFIGEVVEFESVKEESERVKEESERVKEESERVKEESERVKEESERLKEESERVKEESERVKEESERVKEESERVKEESERVKEESERVNSLHKKDLAELEGNPNPNPKPDPNPN
jgi:methyl-accepting chemotaxis protein